MAGTLPVPVVGPKLRSAKQSCEAFQAVEIVVLVLRVSVSTCMGIRAHREVLGEPIHTRGVSLF